MELFDDEVAEVVTDAHTRYVLQRNPERAKEMAGSRSEKLAVLRKGVEPISTSRSILRLGPRRHRAKPLGLPSNSRSPSG